jgi:alcohol dehydrogenase (cytochrome c)
MKKLVIVTALLVGPALLYGQSQSGGLDPAEIMKPLADQWTSYSGDLSGKRFSALKLVSTNTVKNLSLKWVTSLTTGCGPSGTPPAGAAGGGFGGGRGGRGGGGGPAAPIIVGGLGNGDANGCNPARLGGGILFVDGIIYASTPDNVYAIDARDGALLWHYYWKTRGGTSLQGGLEARDRTLRSAVLLLERAHGDWGSHSRGHRKRP